MAKETLGIHLEIIIRNHDFANAILVYGYDALIAFPQFGGAISKQISERINSVDVKDIQFLGTLVLLKHFENSLGTKAKFPIDPSSPVPEETVAFSIIKNIFEERTLQRSSRDIDSFLRFNEKLIREKLPLLDWPF